MTARGLGRRKSRTAETHQCTAEVEICNDRAARKCAICFGHLSCEKRCDYENLPSCVRGWNPGLVAFADSGFRRPRQSSGRSEPRRLLRIRLLPG